MNSTLKSPTKKNASDRAQLLAKIQRLNKRHGPVIGSAKCGKSPSKMTVAEMRAAISEWEATLAACPKTGDWQDTHIGSEFVTASGGGTIWTAYLGFYVSKEAGRWMEFLLREEHGTFAIMRESSRCKQPFEIKVWQPSPELLDAMLQGDLRSLRPRRMEFDEQEIEADIDRF